MTVDDIKRTVEAYKAASANAKAAGFDGVEVHGAYIYLIPEFLNSATNVRTDEYGGSPENRSRFVLEIIEAVIDVWGPGRVALKLSPGVRSGLVSANADTVETYTYLVRKLDDYPLAFLHGWRFPGAEAGSHAEPFNDLAAWLRPLYKGSLMVGGGYTKETGEAALQAGKLDAVAYATPFIANPDLVSRFKSNYPLAEPNRDTFYAGGEDGYNDYPEYAATAA
jgi:N-ethylmaleimide reductase